MTNQVSAIKLTYGYLELREYYYKAAKRAVTFAVSAHLLAISSYFISQFIFQEDEPVYTVRIMKYSDLGPPPSIENAEAAPRVNIAEPSAKPTVGIPIPVPDADINPEATIATQEELAAVSNDAVAEGVGSGEIKIEDEGPPADFVPVEKNPVPVKQIAPAYPEIARRAGVEGTVWVKIWVDKEGKAKRAQVLKSDAELFNQPSIDAAMKWVFTPAIMNNGPVAVWVSIPFKFKLNQGR